MEVGGGGGGVDASNTANPGIISRMCTRCHLSHIAVPITRCPDTSILESGENFSHLTVVLLDSKIL